MCSLSVVEGLTTKEHKGFTKEHKGKLILINFRAGASPAPTIIAFFKWGGTPARGAPPKPLRRRGI